MGFKLDDLITPKRQATAVTPVADFPSDHSEKPDVEAAQAVQATTTEPEKCRDYQHGRGWRYSEDRLDPTL